MSIQYAGGSIINATMASPAGTRAELAQWVRDQLILAGWTSAGTATDYQLTSATTIGGNLACRVRVYDPGSGSCARLKFSNSIGTRTQAGDMFLLPGAGKTWRIIANRYQFFVMTSTNTAREFACGGVPFLPIFLQGIVTEAIWGVSNASADTDTTTRPSFRGALHCGYNPNTASANQVGICNGTIAEFNNTNPGAVYPGSTIQVSDATPGSAIVTVALMGRRWHDDSLQMVEPLIAWGLTNLSSDEPKFRGQLWDAVVLSDAFTADTSLAIDGRTYFCITGGNVGTQISGSLWTMPGTLAVAVT
jgi:hypothetical protein